MPDLTAQPLVHRDVGDRCYEFCLVYGPDRQLDRERCFWLITPLNEGDLPETRILTYGEHKARAGRRAVKFSEFFSFLVPVETIERWFARAAPEKRLERVGRIGEVAVDRLR
ncbi:MAG: hypothetical protein HY698_14135 [Deltaproteobacteria bacterium]|nr:hypothetical protein [Deltaproteobacteria bacterium]